VSWRDSRSPLCAVVLTAGDTPPDVIVTGPYSPFQEASLGLLEPLDRYLARWKYTSRFPTGRWDVLSWQGQVVAVPQSLDLRGIGYNKRLYAESGLDPERPPSSWEELSQYTKRLTRTEGGRVTVRGYWCHTTTGGVAQQLYWFMRQAGLSEVTNEGTSNLLHPEAHEALQASLELWDAGQNSMPASGRNDFTLGQVAMQYLSPPNLSWLQDSGMMSISNVGLFAPRRSPDSIPVAHLFANGLGVSSASRRSLIPWTRNSLRELAG
jgi:ABC-type glycerol-3-phosphate transport system substrate-binding protein